MQARTLEAHSSANNTLYGGILFFYVARGGIVAILWLDQSMAHSAEPLAEQAINGRANGDQYRQEIKYIERAGRVKDVRQRVYSEAETLVKLLFRP